MTPLRVITFIVLFVLSTSTARAKSVQELVDAWVARADLQGVSIGVSVRRVSTGESLAVHEGDRLMNPASGAKLLTTSAALLLLGPDHRWSTRLFASEHVLRFVGGGDPALLAKGIDALAERAVDRLGPGPFHSLVVDTSRHDGNRVPPAFEQKDTDAYYRPAVGPAGSHYGALEITTRPAERPGPPLEVTVVPAGSGVEVICTARTVFERAPDTPPLTVVTMSGDAGRVRVTVTGAMIVDEEPRKERRRVPDPDALTGYLLRDALVARGIKAQESVVKIMPAVDSTFVASEVGAYQSAPLSLIVRDINVWSNNYMAEALMKELSQAPGAPLGDGAGFSWPGGIAAATHALEGLELSPDGFRVVNGSGLYRATHVSAATMTNLLVRMLTHPELGSIFRESLGVAGGEGWLRHRLKGPKTRGKVRAKTGTLDEVVSLSGIAPMHERGEVAFSILINDATPARTRKLRRAMDALVTQLVKLR